MSTLIVIAKAPVPGRSKTRLCPPYTPQQAADLAEAALVDTLRAVAATPGVTRRVLVLEGRVGSWLPAGFEVIAQRGDGLDERLAHAFEDVGGPALLIGMDTPQVTPLLLADALALLAAHEAVIGLAPDGGYWAVGLQEAHPEVFLGVPMSVADTAARQLERLANFDTALLPSLRDVDTERDARAVAALAPHTAFAALVAA